MPPATAVARQTSPAGMSRMRLPSGWVSATAASPPRATEEAPTRRPIWMLGSPALGPGAGPGPGGLGAQPNATAPTTAHATLFRSAAVIAKLELDAEVLP